MHPTDYLRRHGKTGRVAALDTEGAIAYLRNARDILSHAPKAQAKVRKALKSVEGAWRHAQGIRNREEEIYGR